MSKTTNKMTWLLIASVMCFVVTGCSSNTKIKSALKSYVDAIKNKDYVKMVAFIPPSVVTEMSSGSESVVEIVRESMSPTDIEEFKIGKIQIVKEGDILVAVIEKEITARMVSNNIKIKTVGAIFGISEDKGDSWYFVEGNDIGKSFLVSVAPSVVQKLNFRESELYVFTNGQWQKQAPSSTLIEKGAVQQEGVCDVLNKKSLDIALELAYLKVIVNKDPDRAIREYGSIESVNEKIETFIIQMPQIGAAYKKNGCKMSKADEKKADDFMKNLYTEYPY